MGVWRRLYGPEYEAQEQRVIKGCFDDAEDDALPIKGPTRREEMAEMAGDEMKSESDNKKKKFE